MSDPALSHPFISPLTTFLKFRTDLWACLLSILVLLPACTEMRSAGLHSEKGLGIAPLAGPNLGPQAERLTLPGPISKAKESTTSQRFQANFAQLPLSFILNRGQVDERVKFYGRSGPASFFFARDEVVYAFARREEGAPLRKVGRSITRESPGRSEDGKVRSHVIRLKFVGADPDPMIEGREVQPGKVNYFIGSSYSRWKKGLPTYGQVCYRELWPGIDLIYRGEGGQLKYEFLVKPGADPRHIQLAYRGIEEMSLNYAGDLVLKTASGELRDSQPVAYQEIDGKRVEIEAVFRLLPAGPEEFGHGYEVGGYDPAYPLILDPGLEYSTFVGGKGWDIGNGIALDSAGNVYVTGQAGSLDFPTTAGAFDVTGYIVFVVKLSPDGSTLLYSTLLGGRGWDNSFGIVLDGAGSAYVIGETRSPDFPATAGAFDTSYNGGDTDGFITRLSADGSALLYSTFLGGSGSDSVNGITLDFNNNAYVSGRTLSSDFPAITGAFDPSYNGGGDAFVAKLSADGSTLHYSTFLGGSSEDHVYGVALDAAGNGICQ